MTGKFRVRDTKTNVLQTEGTWYTSTWGDVLVEYEGEFDLFPKGMLKIEWHTGFNDKEGNEIYQYDIIEVSYNKQDADFLKKQTYILFVDWDAYHGQWHTYQKVGDKIMPYAALYSIAKKCKVVNNE